MPNYNIHIFSPLPLISAFTVQNCSSHISLFSYFCKINTELPLNSANKLLTYTLHFLSKLPHHNILPNDSTMCFWTIFESQQLLNNWKWTITIQSIGSSNNYNLIKMYLSDILVAQAPFLLFFPLLDCFAL